MSAFLSLTKDESQAERQRIAGKVTLAVALTCFALFLFGKGLTILTKLTGLFVSAIAAQLFFTGFKNFLA